MILKSMQLGQIGTNCYIFGDEKTKKCAVVDPGDDGDRVAKVIRDAGLEPVCILLTHSHFDHILGIPGLREAYPGLPVYCHPADIPAETQHETFGMQVPTVTAFGDITPYNDGDKVTVGPMTAEVLHTPGHTPGSVSLRVGDVLFTGDTLFRGSMGRTDLPGGSYQDIMASLRRLGNLPGDYQVKPGHEGDTTMDRERHFNYYLLDAMGL